MSAVPAQRSHGVVKTHTGLHIVRAIRENINNNDNDENQTTSYATADGGLDKSVTLSASLHS